METEYWTKERDKSRRFVIRNSLISTMNNTKWLKLQAIMISENVITPKYRFKCLRDSNVKDFGWEYDWEYHLPPFEIIEWLELDPIYWKSNLISEDLTHIYIELLEKNNIPHSLVNRFIRITGYRYP